MSKPPLIDLNDPSIITLDEAAELELLRTGPGTPARTPTLRVWATEGIAGLVLPTARHRLGKGFRVVTTPEALMWLDCELFKLRHPRIAAELGVGNE